jgi:hypothetical protein
MERVRKAKGESSRWEGRPAGPSARSVDRREISADVRDCASCSNFIVGKVPGGLRARAPGVHASLKKLDNGFYNVVIRNHSTPPGSNDGWSTNARHSPIKFIYEDGRQLIPCPRHSF